MLLRSILRPYYVLALVLCASANDDFDWTKNEKTSFYYGTFPTGTTPRSHRSKRCSHLQSVELYRLLCVRLQVSPGELAALPIRPKELGTQMAKE